MKLIQQDFKVSSYISCFLFLIITIFISCCYLFVNYNTLLIKIMGLIGILIVSISVYNTYCLSFIYEFKQKEIIVAPLFGILGKKRCSFKDLKKIEYSISPKGTMDSINLYFENREYKSKISISMWQVDLSKIRLFLYANIENFEELVEEKQRRFV